MASVTGFCDHYSKMLPLTLTILGAKKNPHVTENTNTQSSSGCVKLNYKYMVAEN